MTEMGWICEQCGYWVASVEEAEAHSDQFRHSLAVAPMPVGVSKSVQLPVGTLIEQAASYEPDMEIVSLRVICDGCGGVERVGLDEMRLPEGWLQTATGDLCPHCQGGTDDEHPRGH